MNNKNRLLQISALAVYAFLYLPLLIVAAYSFNNSKLNAEWAGFTFKWYIKLFHNDEMISAAGNSLIIASISAIVATVLGTLAGMAMHNYRLKLLPGLVLAPIAMPDILMGVSLLLFFIMLNMSLGLVSVTLAHITFCIGFVALSVQARMSGIDRSLTEAARDLGANPWQCFGMITLPLLAPGIMAGALMAFTLSIDDFVVTYFVAGVGTSTLPLQIYSMVKIAVTPEVNAISTLLMLLTLILITLVARLSPSALRS